MGDDGLRDSEISLTEENVASHVDKYYIKVKVEGDGQCLFRALAVSMYGTQERHLEIKKEICEYLSTNWDDIYSGIISSTAFDKDDVIRECSAEESQGNEYTLQSATHKYNAIIWLKHNGTWRRVGVKGKKPVARTLFLDYTGSGRYGHYDAYMLQNYSGSDTEVELNLGEYGLTVDDIRNVTSLAIAVESAEDGVTMGAPMSLSTSSPWSAPGLNSSLVSLPWSPPGFYSSPALRPPPPPLGWNTQYDVVDPTTCLNPFWVQHSPAAVAAAEAAAAGAAAAAAAPDVLSTPCSTMFEVIKDFESYLKNPDNAAVVKEYKAILLKRPISPIFNILKYPEWRRAYEPWKVEHDAVYLKIKEGITSLRARYTQPPEEYMTAVSNKVFNPTNREDPLIIKAFRSIYTGVKSGAIQLFKEAPPNVQNYVANVTDLLALSPKMRDWNDPTGNEYNYNVLNGQIIPKTIYGSPFFSWHRFTQVIGYSEMKTAHVTAPMVYHDFLTRMRNLTVSDVNAIAALDYTTQDPATMSLDSLEGQQLARSMLFRGGLDCASHLLNNPGTVIVTGQSDMCLLFVALLQKTERPLRDSLYNLLSEDQTDPGQYAATLQQMHGGVRVEPILIKPLNTTGDVYDTEYVTVRNGFTIEGIHIDEDGNTTVTFQNATSKNFFTINSNLKAPFIAMAQKAAERLQKIPGVPLGWAQSALKKLFESFSFSATTATIVFVVLASLVSTAYFIKARVSPAGKLRAKMERLSSACASGLNLAHILTFEAVWPTGTATHVRKSATNLILKMVSKVFPASKAATASKTPAASEAPDAPTMVLRPAIHDAQKLRDKLAKLSKLMRDDYDALN